MKRIFYIALVFMLNNSCNAQDYKTAIDQLKEEKTPIGDSYYNFKQGKLGFNSQEYQKRAIVNEMISEAALQHQKLFSQLEKSAKGYFFGVNNFKKRLNAMDRLNEKEVKHIDGICSSYRLGSHNKELRQVQKALTLPLLVSTPIALGSLLAWDTIGIKIVFAISSLPAAAFLSIEAYKQLAEKSELRQNNIREALLEKCDI
ncbi:hypothetical protein HYX58_02975 [Candidatus Dependentiae bacterium]|nr:hypothetical protein [Candidatus Dependentiae bacterium]